MKKDNWIIKAFLMTFFISIIFNTASNLIINNFNYIALIVLSIVFIFLGIFSDIIGTAILTAEESIFHAKSSRRIKGSKEGVYLIKNASKIASICNDVIGDICGIVSGSVGAMLSIYLSNTLDTSIVITTLLVGSIISSLTVGGKAIGKKYAIKNSNDIVHAVGKSLSFLNIK